MHATATRDCLAVRRLAPAMLGVLVSVCSFTALGCSTGPDIVITPVDHPGSPSAPVTRAPVSFEP